MVKHKNLKSVSKIPVRTFPGHTNQVNACAMSPDASFIVSAAGNILRTVGGHTVYSIKVWDFETGVERYTLSGHTWPVRGCAVSMDNTKIISVAEDGLIVWDSKTGELINRFEYPGFACSSCTDESAIAVVSFFSVIIDIHTGEEHESMLTNDMLHDCAITHDGSLVVTAGTDQHLVLWDANIGEEIATLIPKDRDGTKPSDDVYACSISPDGTFLVSGGSDGFVRIWDVKTFSEKDVLAGHDNDVTGCAVSPNNSLIVSSSWDGTLKIWEVKTGREIATLEGHLGAVNDCTFSLCGRYILSAGDDMTMKVWEIK